MLSKMISTENFQSQVVDFLSRPDSYEGRADPVGRIQTHISELFIVGEFAYKLKRAVPLPYLDFSTLKLRHEACLTEIKINRRTAPDFYLGVVPVTQDPFGVFCIDGSGDVVEWLVKMRRFDDKMLFRKLADCCGLTVSMVEKLAESIAVFHQKRKPIIRSLEPDRTRNIIDLNLVSLLEHGGDIVASDEARQLTTRTVDTLTKMSPLLKRREGAGFVRHCHGDLHLSNIFLFNDEPVLFDAIEFNLAFAEIDVFYDLAFLLMDLDCSSLRPLANAVLNRYIDISGDVEGLALLPLFLSLRASVLTHVGLTKRSQIQSDNDPKHTDQIVVYYNMALNALEPPHPQLIAVGGLSGSGKSSLAHRIAPEVGAAPGARVVRTDVIRKRIAGIGLYEKLPPESYTREASQQTYDAALTEARDALQCGHSVIFDAVFARAEERRLVMELALELGVPFQGFWLDAPVDTLVQRVDARVNDASDATGRVVKMQLEYETGLIDWHQIDASEEFDATYRHVHQILQSV